MAEQESRLAIVIDTAGAEARIKALKEQLKALGGAADNAADDTADLGNSADRASRDTNRLNASAASGEKALDKMGKAAAVAGALLAGGLALSVNKAQSWETSMAEINKTVNFAASDGLANMRKELQVLTTQIPQTFEELAAVTATGGQLGIAEKDLIGFTETMAKMGVAFDIPAQQAADSMAKIANVFQIPIANIDRLGDAINTLSNNTPATAAQLIDSLQRVGGVAKVFGLSEDATLGLTGALIAMGKPAEVASTAVNSLLTSFSTLDNATKSQLIGFEQLGLNIDDFSKLVATDGKQAIITYLEAINKLEQSKRIGTNALIIGKDFGDDITMLAGSVEVLEKNWAMLGETANTTKDYFGSMDEEFVKISATSANKMKLFKQNIDGVVVGIGDAFIPALNELLLNMTPLIATLSVWVSENPELIKQIVVIGGSLLAAVVSMKLFADGVNAAKTTIDGLKFAYAALSSPMALTIIALGALLVAGVLVYQNWETIKQTVSENKGLFMVLGGVVGGVSAILLIHNAALIASSVAAAAAAVSTAVMTAATVTWTAISTVAATATWAFGAAIAFVTSPIGILVLAIAGLIAIGVLLYKNWDTINAYANAKWAAITSYIGNKINEIKNYFSTNFPAMTTIVSGSIEIIKTLFVGGFNLIKNTVTTVLGVIKAVISGDFKAIPGIIGNGLKGAVTIVGNMMGQILDVIKNYGKKLFSLGRDFIGGFIDGIKSMASGAASAASTMAGNAIEAVRKRQQSNSPAKATIKLGKDLGDGYIGGIKSKTKAVKTEAQKMAEGAIEAVQTGIDRIKKELALFGNNSNLADLEYDIKIGKYDGASDAKKTEYRNLVAELEAKTKLAAANKTVQDSIDGLMKQQALFGNSSSLASLMYDIEHTDKYKDATKELTDKLIEQTRALEQLGMTAKATAAIQARFAQLGKDKEASQKAVDGVMTELVNESPMAKIEADYARRLEIIATNEMLETGIIGSMAAERLAIEQSYQDAKQQLMLSQSEAIFSGLAGMSKGFLGEQSGVYRTLYAMQKGYALSSALLSSKKAIMDAWSNTAGGFWSKAAAAGKVALSTSAITSAIAGLSPQGFKSGGYTGNMGASQVAGVVHGQEYVFDAQSTKRIGVDNLNAMRSGKGTGETKVIVNNYSNEKANVQTTPDGDTIVTIGKMLIPMMDSRIQKHAIKSTRQGW